MSYILTAAAPSPPPPTCFVRKARASCLHSFSAESTSKATRSQSGVRENDRHVQVECFTCPSANHTSSRAKYNKVIGAMILEETLEADETDQSKDFDRFEELFLLMSMDKKE